MNETHKREDSQLKQKLQSTKETAEKAFFDRYDLSDKETKMKFQICFYLIIFDSAFILGFAVIGILYFLARLMSILSSLFMVILFLMVIAVCVSHISKQLPDGEYFEEELLDDKKDSKNISEGTDAD